MMIFNYLLLPATITILARNDRTAAVVAFSSFEDICLALAGKFPQKGVVNSFCI